MVSTFRKKLAIQLKAKRTRGVTSVENRMEVLYAGEYGNPSDEMIQNTAESILTANPDIDASKILVAVNTGVLTLKGSVTWFWQLHRVEDLVSNIIGVVEVENELAVVPSERISDEIIAHEINQELEQAEHADPGKILVEVKNGSVILSGSVRTYLAEQEAHEAAIQQAGVTQVDNNITIAPIVA
jgi:osmotically-inducible protein OsmY